MRDLFLRHGDVFVRFRSYRVFRFFEQWYKLIDLRIFEDGRFDVEDEIWSWTDLIEAVNRGELCTRIPDRKRLRIQWLASFIVRDVIASVDEAEFLKEVADIQRELRGEPTTIDHCRQIYARFQGSPTEENRLLLKEAHDAVPKHLRIRLLGFDEKDIPIRQAIYGDDFLNH